MGNATKQYIKSSGISAVGVIFGSILMSYNVDRWSRNSKRDRRGGKKRTWHLLLIDRKYFYICSQYPASIVIVIKGVVRGYTEDGENLFVKSHDEGIIYKIRKSNILSRKGDIVEFDKDKAEESEFRFPEKYKRDTWTAALITGRIRNCRGPARKDGDHQTRQGDNREHLRASAIFNRLRV